MFLRLWVGRSCNNIFAEFPTCSDLCGVQVNFPSWKPIFPITPTPHECTVIIGSIHGECICCCYDNNSLPCWVSSWVTPRCDVMARSDLRDDVDADHGGLRTCRPLLSSLWRRKSSTMSRLLKAAAIVSATPTNRRHTWWSSKTLRRHRTCDRWRKFNPTDRMLN